MNVRNKDYYTQLASDNMAKAEAILNQAEGRDLTPSEKGQADELLAQAESATTKAKFHAQAEVELPGIIAKKQGVDLDQVPAKVRTASSTLFRNVKDAYDAGQWIRATFMGSQEAQTYCHRHGLIKATMLTNNNPAGGFLVPEPLEDAIIELREQFGVFRRNAAKITMGNGRMTLPRVSGEVTAYYVSEGSTITASDMAVNQVTLDAKKLATLTTMSSELSEDSVVSVSEMLARSIAYTFAVQEDEAGFNGTGTSATGGIVGLAGALEAGSKHTATSNDVFDDLTLVDFESVIGKAKLFGRNQKWYISNPGYFASMVNLMNAVGGNSNVTLANGAPSLSFMGYPVEIAPVLEDDLTGTTTKIACYFGDLSAGAFIGTRRGITLAIDSSLYFHQDVLALRATQRFDIVVHDKGTPTVAGGLIALVFG